MNIEWDNKYNASKIGLPSSVQRKFDEMHLYERNAIIRHGVNFQRLEISQMNIIILEIKNSVIDSEIKWYKGFIKAIGRQEFYVKGYLTWSKDRYLELPGQTNLKHGDDDVPNISPHKCCYFSIDEYHDYYLQGWTREDSKTAMDKPDLIRIRYGQMRILDPTTPDLVVTSA